MNVNIGTAPLPKSHPFTLPLKWFFTNDDICIQTIGKVKLGAVLFLITTTCFGKFFRPDFVHVKQSFDT
jgi:hypothetical protein